MATLTGTLPQKEVLEEELLRLEEEYWQMRSTLVEEHPQVQYAVQEFRARLKAYEQCVLAELED